MRESKLKSLLRARRNAEEFEYRVIGALNLRYRRVDKEKAVAKESATAGHVYSYLSRVLKEPNSSKFQAKVKAVLKTKDIIKPVSSGGILWFKGLAGLDEDIEKAHEVLRQHYVDRTHYRVRQREFAKKRYDLPTATKTEPGET